MKSIFKLLICALLVLPFQSCGGSKRAVNQQSVSALNINLILAKEGEANKFVNLDYGIRLSVRDSRATTKILNIFDASVTTTPQTSVYPDVTSFVSESTRRYMRTMGFNLDANIATDYYLTVQIKEYNVSYLSGIGWSGLVQLGIEVHDSNRKQVYPSVTAVGRANVSGSSRNSAFASRAINNAFVAALDDVDWDQIAFFLRKADSPALEKNKQVTGEGNTALESTVIRWYIESAPRGADVYTRVVSSTPDVKNTNQTYVGTTPYETTETFDIKGLTYNNSGNVQIEVICEKAGYITQKKRFNLRQAIDQKEIATKFNLVKEE